MTSHLYPFQMIRMKIINTLSLQALACHKHLELRQSSYILFGLADMFPLQNFCFISTGMFQLFCDNCPIANTSFYNLKRTSSLKRTQFVLARVNSIAQSKALLFQYKFLINVPATCMQCKKYSFELFCVINLGIDLIKISKLYKLYQFRYNR